MRRALTRNQEEHLHGNLSSSAGRQLTYLSVCLSAGIGSGTHLWRFFFDVFHLGSYLYLFFLSSSKYFLLLLSHVQNPTQDFATTRRRGSLLVRSSRTSCVRLSAGLTESLRRTRDPEELLVVSGFWVGLRAGGGGPPSLFFFSRSPASAWRQQQALKQEHLHGLLTAALAVLVVGVEASLQQLGHLLHLAVLDQVHELPQIGL